jgi:UDP-GlcNAc3NAcA epimerase
VLVGDVMADAVLQMAGRALEASDAEQRHGLTGRRYAIATLHRAESTTAAVLPELMAALEDCSREFDVTLLPLHPRTAAALEAHCPGWSPGERIRVCEPLGHLDMLRLLQGARAVLTDSGGLQKEAFLLGTPCVTLRTETEWVESVEAGGNVVGGLERTGIVAALAGLLESAPQRSALAARAAESYGDGTAAGRIVSALAGLAGLAGRIGAGLQGAGE